MARQMAGEASGSLSAIVVSDLWSARRNRGRISAAVYRPGNQEGNPAEEFMLVESSRLKGRISRDVAEMVPNMRTLYAEAESSYELKILAAEAATGEWMAIVDAGPRSLRAWRIKGEEMKS